MTFRVVAFVRSDGGGLVRHEFGSYESAEEAEEAAQRAVTDFADYARCEGLGGTTRLFIPKDYDSQPIPFGAISRAGIARDDAANDEGQPTT